MTKANPVINIFTGHRLTGEQAYMTARILEQVVSGLWRTYGDDMADFQGRVFPDEPSPYQATYCRDNKTDDGNDDF